MSIDGQGRLEQARRDLLTIYQAALDAVNGRVAVRQELRAHPMNTTDCRLIAIGKAAAAMARGALDVLGSNITDGLVISKYGHGDAGLEHRFTCLEAGHPLPDPASLEAGRALIEFIASSPEDTPFIFLISGGTSALVEVLPEGVTLADLARANQWLLGSGLSIDKMNRVRSAVSCIKGGRLVDYLQARQARVLLISDVPDNDPAVIGSGLLTASQETAVTGHLPGWLQALIHRTPGQRYATTLPNVETRIVACLEDAKQTAAQQAEALGHATYVHQSFLAGDAERIACERVRELKQAPQGVHIWGGETTVRLPERPGRGGRNQHLALAAALEMERQAMHDCALLAAGTDGSDGPTGDAGAMVDGGTCERGRLDGLNALGALTAADAGGFLQASGDLLQTGPTGTNVMDLLIGLKLPGCFTKAD